MQNSVRLKAIFGVKPEVWLVYLYSFLLIILISAIILLPGILRNGSHVEIWSNVAGAELFVDEQRFGAIPGSYFIERGNRSILLRREGFLPHSEDIDVRGRLFFSLFFPRRDTMTILLETDRSMGAREFRKPTLLGMSSWGLHQVSAVRQVPPVFDEYAISALARGDEALPAPPFTLIGNEQQLRDLLRGYSRLRSDSLVPGSFGLSTLLAEGITNMDDSLLSQLKAILSSDTDLTYLEQIAYPRSPENQPENQLENQPENQPENLAETPASAPILAKLRSFGYGGSLIERDSHLIMDSPVNYALFQFFLAEQELWTEDRFRELESEGLSSANYFLHDPLGNPIHSSGSEPVRAINALAVFAFIDWLGQDLDGVNIRLPYPHEFSTQFGHSLWEYSAQYAQAHQSAGLSEPALILRAGEMRALQDAILAGRGREEWYQTFMSAGIQVQNNAQESGMLSPTMVSPVSTFRLVFEGR